MAADRFQITGIIVTPPGRRPLKDCADTENQSIKRARNLILACKHLAQSTVNERRTLAYSETSSPPPLPPAD